MTGKNTQYTIGLQGAPVIAADIAGDRAIEYVKMLKNDIPVSPAFVVTGFALDDFLTSANIIDDIAVLLRQVNGELETAREISEQIEQLIIKANYPALVLNPILQSYKNISGFTDKPVSLQPSWILPNDLIPENSQLKYGKRHIRGDAALLFAIKQVWAALFSPEALLLRFENEYAGELSISVLVQKEIQAEVTGEVSYPADHPGYEQSDLAEITALLGTNFSNDPQLQPDYYLVDTNQSTILEKSLSLQPYMYVHQGRRYQKNNGLAQIDISPEWQRRQKLGDGYILDLSLIAKNAGNLIDAPIKIGWGYEAGKLYVTHLQRIKEFKLAQDNTQSRIDKTLFQPESELSVEIDPEIQHFEEAIAAQFGEYEEESEETEQSEQSNPVDFEKLASEVEQLSQELSDDLELDFVDAQELEVSENVNRVEYGSIEQMTSVIKNTALDLMLDVSFLSSGELSLAQKFDGAYYDATPMVESQDLPEHVFSDKTKLNQLAESYAADISMIARVIEPAPLFYSFSNIDNAGSERFVLNPESLRGEAVGLRKARNSMAVRNLRLILPYLRSQPELEAVKRTLATEGLQRTNSLQIWIELSAPAMLHEIDHIAKNDIDGVIVNVNQLIKNMMGREQLMERDVNTAFLALQKSLQSHSFNLIFKINPTLVVLNKITDYGFHPQGLVLNNQPDLEFLQNLPNKPIFNLQKNKQDNKKPVLRLREPTPNSRTKPLFDI